MGGTAAPGLVSVLYAQAPPWVLSCIQYPGGTQSYGPVIFTPLGPLTVVGLALADEIVGRWTRSPRARGLPHGTASEWLEPGHWLQFLRTQIQALTERDGSHLQ